MEECLVCCEALKKPVTCKLCDYTACYKCFSKFMIDMTVHAKCMNCDKPWSRKQLVESFGQYFVSNKYKKKRQDVLFDLEKAMLPDTQPLAVRKKHIQNINSIIYNHENQIREIQARLRRNDLEPGILEDEFNEYLERRKLIRLELYSHREDISNLTEKKHRLMILPLKNEKKQNTLVIKCPRDSCRGYINSKNMKCEICQTKLCRECHEILNNGAPLNNELEEHTCNPDTVKTVKLMMNDSKNCPSCKAMIYKIDGCDQMFCTQCHTAFSWKTGEVTLGRIHNPHYYEYLRRNGAETRELGDIPCGGIPRLTREILQNKYLSKVHQRASHIELYEIPRLNNYLNDVNGNVDLRINYLNEEMGLLTFKAEIYKREKAREKKREILTVLNTFVVVCADIFRNRQDQSECKIEFENIRKFTNETLSDVSRIYGCVVPTIDEFWEIKNVKF